METQASDRGTIPGSNQGQACQDTAKIGPQHAQLLLTHFLAPHRPPEV
jgi:hypothetical protein